MLRVLPEPLGPWSRRIGNESLDFWNNS